MTFGEVIRRADLFGYPVLLRYRDDNSKRHSAYGGVLTILLVCTMCYQVVWNILKISNPNYSSI